MTVDKSVFPNIYNIQSGEPFARSLVRKLLHETGHEPELLANYWLVLPTRRACRIMAETFLEESEGRALLLPRLQAVGHIDEEELSLSIAGSLNSAPDLSQFLALKPGISGLRRQIILTRLILARGDFQQGHEHAFKLAGALGQLMDQIYTEGLHLQDLVRIVPHEFAQHWQITLDFLNILSDAWPAILAEDGMMDTAARRERLIRGLSALWRENPPQSPIIAAGTTGSIPATADFLKIVCRLPQGRVVLPGFDANLDQESWDSMGESHPQFGFKTLLQRLEATPDQVRNWNPGPSAPITTARRILAGEIMRPAQTAAQWHELKAAPARETLMKGLDHLQILECANEREEATAIALLIRETLEHPHMRVALITPDRGLARRVSTLCKRWQITVDDSAGQRLDQTPLGEFLILTAQACISRVAPVDFMALCKHDLFTAGLKPQLRHAALQQLEAAALRGLKPMPGFAALRQRLQNAASSADLAAQFLDIVEPLMQSFIDHVSGAETLDFAKVLKTHILLCEALAARPGRSGAEILWRGEAGEMAAQLLSELVLEAATLPAMRAQDYIESLRALLQTVTVRVSYGQHPRVRILGQIEARLVDANRVILGGLNEGTWPAEPGHDPWMSRRMRQDFGLPSSERSIGLAAHDFVQGFCSDDVILTRSLRNGGVSTVPARWLQRLEAVMQAAGLDVGTIKAGTYTAMARALDEAGEQTPCKRPAPTPPVHLRPNRLSVTRVENWMQDPYGIYARYVLRLRKIDPLEKPLESNDKGNLLHKILERFARDYPEDLPSDSVSRLAAYAREEIGAYHQDPAIWQFWWARFEKTAAWLVEYETEWRENHRILKTEASGVLNIEYDPAAPPFKLTAKADRIDQGPEGAVIIDYKSGGTFTKTAIRTGLMPQLPLEALILSSGGFAELPACPIEALVYLKLSGGTKPGEPTMVDSETKSIVEETFAGLTRLISCFAQESTPFICLPNPQRLPRFNDYEHLARVREWTALSDEDDAEEAA